MVKRNFFFSKSEIRGIIVLLIIIAILLAIRFIMYSRLDRYELHTYYSNDTSAYYQSEENYTETSELDNPEKTKKLIPGQIDPNTATFKNLIAIGFPARVARTLIKYREKGGIFHSPDDLFKVYGFDTILYSATRKYLHFISYEKEPLVNSKNAERAFRIEINQSDSITLKKLPGIGTVLAARIVKYRNALGGFYSSKQLSEVYGISDSLKTELEKFIETDTSLISKLNLNSLTFEELERHPYLNRYQAKAILSYRRLIGPFTSVDQLVTNYLIPEETYYRLLPYLTVK